ncbi:ABC transporter permease [Selenomonadales bacterium OttesenSCG-928-I06]|nr:ABC transporter permease [Selenomonadales bacterium OttesenSCG-928-I06]
MQWYYIYWREMLLLYKKIGKLGYIFSSIMMPLLYLFAFGLGLGGRDITGGNYVEFLAKGIIGITVMMNAFQQTSLSVSIGRFYFGTFQTVILSPIKNWQIIFGLSLAGVVRGMLMGFVVYGVAWMFFDISSISPLAVLAIFISAFCFSALGLVVGLYVNNPDALSLVNNFLLMPMTLFCGSFFPITNLPAWIGSIIEKLPLSIVNSLVRTDVLGPSVWQDISILILIGLACLWLGTNMLTRYSE